MYGFLTTCFLAIATMSLSPPDFIVDTVSGNDITVSDGNLYNQDISLLNDINDKLDIVVTALSPSVDSVQVTDYYINYFRGVLQNMPDTDYLCFAQRINNGYNNYTTHYYLMYDLDVVDGVVTPANYPCIDVYTYNSVQYCDEITKYFAGYPTMGYASFFPYSALTDKSYDYALICVIFVGIMAFFVICRKTVFS